MCGGTASTDLHRSSSKLFTIECGVGIGSKILENASLTSLNMICLHDHIGFREDISCVSLNHTPNKYRFPIKKSVRIHPHYLSSDR